MKILLTGANGYIGKRLLPSLVKKGHHVVCCVRDSNRFNPPKGLLYNTETLQVDFLNKYSLRKIPKDIDAAYYLMHSMSTSKEYMSLELKSAINFRNAIDQTNAKHVVYLSGIVNDEDLSQHLSSRKAVELELNKGKFHFTTLRAGIIIGSGSASYEIIRDLVEKLPIMLAPVWVKTKCQPIGIADVISFLSETLFNEATFDRNFDIGGPDILSYKEMLLGYAKVRGLKRKIWTLPFMTPKSSAYWLFFITSISFKLVNALVKSMRIEVVCRDSDLNGILKITPISYEEALRRTLVKTEGGQVISSWKDSFISGGFEVNLSDFMQVPTHGCFVDVRSRTINDYESCQQKIWSIGGNTGWYYANQLWQFRGFIDKIVGGVGLRRGRTHETELSVGDALDFWRVLLADKKNGRLLLFAEMKLPGEAWLEFKMKDGVLWQTATFRSKGVWGRLYWLSVFPFHGIIFTGLIKQLTK